MYQNEKIKVTDDVFFIVCHMSRSGWDSYLGSSGPESHVLQLDHGFQQNILYKKLINEHERLFG